MQVELKRPAKTLTHFCMGDAKKRRKAIEKAGGEILEDSPAGDFGHRFLILVPLEGEQKLMRALVGAVSSQKRTAKAKA